MLMKKYKKIVILDSVILYPEHRRRLDQIAEEIVEYNTCRSEEETLERVRGADCVISCWVDISNRVIDENPQLKTIAFWTHAYEHRIDKAYAEARNIYVPCIPDYGTDSVAELLFVGLLRLTSTSASSVKRGVDEEVCDIVMNRIRRFDNNMKANLTGSWIHEYIKNGDLKITSPDGFEEETIKGMTVGLILPNAPLVDDIVKVFADGLHTNVIHSCYDIAYNISASFRPADKLLEESQIIIYDSRIIGEELVQKISDCGKAVAVDVGKLECRGTSLKRKKLGIIGLGRIGTRAAQIARDAFDMEVVYYSRTRKADIERNLGIKYAPMEEVLSSVDILSFHLPHVGAEGVVTNEMIDLVKPGTILVNVSVGNIFKDQDYLLKRFAPGDLSGYLDVYRTLPPRMELRERKQYLLSTYRLGWRTKSTIGLKTHKLITNLALGLE